MLNTHSTEELFRLPDIKQRIDDENCPYSIDHILDIKASELGIENVIVLLAASLLDNGSTSEKSEIYSRWANEYLARAYSQHGIDIIETNRLLEKFNLVAFEPVRGQGVYLLSLPEERSNCYWN